METIIAPFTPAGSYWAQPSSLCCERDVKPDKKYTEIIFQFLKKTSSNFPLLEFFSFKIVLNKFQNILRMRRLQWRADNAVELVSLANGAFVIGALTTIALLFQVSSVSHIIYVNYLNKINIFNK
jgi:hypothetical protein